MSYSKGVHWERELMVFLQSQGLSVLRIAGSGHNTPADIVAFKRGLILAVECKAHATKPRLPASRVKEMKTWCERAGALGFLAWKAPYKDWLFLPLKDAAENNYGDENWLPGEALLRAVL